MADWLRLKRGRIPRARHGQSALYVDGEGVLKLRDSEGTDAEVGAGGGDPSALRRGTFSAEDSVEIANNGLAPLGWADNESEGGPVLDLTNPLQPAVIVAGVYTVTAWVSVTAMTDGGYFEVTLDLDFSGEGASTISAMSRPATTGDPSAPFCLVSDTYYIPAGGTIRLLARSRDGASAQDFAIESASVQQVA